MPSRAEIIAGNFAQSHPGLILDPSLPLPWRARDGLIFSHLGGETPLFVSDGKSAITHLSPEELVCYLRFVAGELYQEAEPVSKLARRVRYFSVIPTGGVVLPNGIPGLRHLLDNERFLQKFPTGKGHQLEGIPAIKAALATADRFFALEIIGKEELERGATLGTVIIKRQQMQDPESIKPIEEYLDERGKLAVKFQKQPRPETIAEIRSISNLAYDNSAEWLEAFVTDENYRPDDETIRRYREKTKGGNLFDVLHRLGRKFGDYLKVVPLDEANGPLKEVLERTFRSIRKEYIRHFLDFALADDEARHAKILSYVLPPVIFLLSYVLENSNQGALSSLLVLSLTDLINDLYAATSARNRYDLSVSQTVKERLPALVALLGIGLASAKGGEMLIESNHQEVAAIAFGSAILASGLVSVAQNAWMKTQRESPEDFSDRKKLKLFLEHFKKTFDNPVLFTVFSAQTFAFLASIAIGATGLYNAPTERVIAKNLLSSLETAGAITGARHSNELIRWRIRRRLNR